MPSTEGRPVVLGKVAAGLFGLVLLLVWVGCCVAGELSGISRQQLFNAAQCAEGARKPSAAPLHIGLEPKVQPVDRAFSDGKLTGLQTFGGKMLDAAASAPHGDEFPSAARGSGAQEEPSGGRGRRILWRHIQ